MKTKFILNGGFNREELQKNNDDFYLEILRNAPKNPKVLLVFFAKEAERLEEASKKIITDFAKNILGQNLIFAIANEDEFDTQISDADVIYFAGGKTLKLLEVLKKFPNLRSQLSGKLIAGESAGANVWSQYCYSPNADRIVNGLGILPIKLIPHYKEEYKGKLDEVGSGSELILLPEYQTRVFIQD